MQKAKYKWHPIFAIVKGAVKIFYPFYKIEGKENVSNEHPVVFICNHLNILGPAVILLFFPIRCRPWVINKMIKLKTCTNYLEKDFVYNDLKIKKRPFSKIAAFLLALFCTGLMRSREAIPTYRDTYKAKLTFEETKKCILNGQNIFIFPEKDKAPFSEYLNEFYTGFAHLGKKVYIEMGIELEFHPVFIDKINKKIVILKAEKFNGKNNFKEEKERIVVTVRNKINEMAVEAHKKRLEADIQKTI